MDEAKRLEQEADAILMEDARKEVDPETGKPYIKNKYGYGKYAKRYGILTAHDVATIRHHEFPADFARLKRQEDEAD